MSPKEILFCVFAYLPKARAQASIGGIALSWGLPCGNLVLAIAVLAIVVTAPVDGFLIELTGRRWIKRFAVDESQAAMKEEAESA